MRIKFVCMCINEYLTIREVIKRVNTLRKLKVGYNL